MTRQRKAIFGGALLAAVAALGIGQAALEASNDLVDAPIFEVDPFWPKPLPNNWVLGSTIGVGVDSRDHVYIIHRGLATLNERTEAGAESNPPTGECCAAAPPILEFDPDGNLVNAWGGPGEGYTWPNSNHGISVDHMDNLWIGGNGAGDSHILVFTRDGRFIREIGQPGQGVDNASRNHFGRVAKISFDGRTNEAFVSDGYLNRRVAVVDMNSGNITRFWGAYGNRPSDENPGPYNPDAPLIQQFRTPVHCAEPSNDGLVYVCDRPNNRIQVFRRDGTFVTEKQIAPRTLGDGSVWDIAFSKDPEQRFIYLADGKNMKVYVMERSSLDVVTSFGMGGRQPGMFFAVHSIATDSQGNIFTTETYEGKRLQKFTYRGIGPVSSQNQRAPWPTR
jgi:DNA-binding beta-propeller fold protein YncE